MQKLRVGIIFGGKSTEHEISLRSAYNIVKYIDKTRFEVVLLGIDEEGKWHLYDSSFFSLNEQRITKLKLNHSINNIALTLGQTKQQFIVVNDNSCLLSQIDVIFPIIHGSIGENGCLQGLLHIASLPFVGSSVLSSAISMDKDFTKRLLYSAGLKVAPWLTFTEKDKSKLDITSIINSLKLPLFIKPSNQGSSIGVSKVNNISEFISGVNHAFSFNYKIILEQEIKGREIECSVLGNTNPQSSLCGEILTNANFYSYNQKYYDEKNDSQIIVPAIIDSNVSDCIRNIAIKVFSILECRGMARVDFFLTEKNEIIVNEINTIPGFTDISMYPKLWQASGICCQKLITQLIELALEEYNKFNN